jgi:hypothetical protein
MSTALSDERDAGVGRGLYLSLPLKPVRWAALWSRKPSVFEAHRVEASSSRRLLAGDAAR